MSHSSHSPSAPFSTRRKFLACTGGAALGSLLDSGVRAEENDDDLQTISVIHTTDLHGHILPTSTYEGVTNVGGLARCSTLIREWRRQNPHNLLIDVGDLYQGTHVSRRNEGALMVKLVNKLHYDAWVLGNHDFDWGIEPAQAAVRGSNMPVLTANLEIDGKAPGRLSGDSHPFSKVAPFIIREIAGFRIGIVGLTTPGLPYWLRPEVLAGLVPTDPAIAVAAAIAEMKTQGVDAIIAAGHMGSHWGNDDFANRVEAITKSNPDLDVYLGGHTHSDSPSLNINRVLYTQANYYGINLGRVDLTFSRSSRKLIDKRAFTVFMDRRFELDPFVLAIARDEIDVAAEELARPIGTVTQVLRGKYEPGIPNGQERLIAAGIRHALAQKQIPIDAVLHGAFVETDMQPGGKTVADLWEIIPYENMIVTTSLTPEQLVVVLEEGFNGRKFTNRNLIGLDVSLGTEGGETKVQAIKRPTTGASVAPGERLTIALNSYDAQSGGRRFLKLKQILEEPESRTAFHPIETRDALIEFFLSQKQITPESLA